MMLPKRHAVRLGELTEQEINDLAEILKKILLKLKVLNADYNFYLQCGIDDMHFHIEVCPRMATWAGFELSTGTIINIMSPESAALYYRS
jgi:UDPglucose--hexose-1-phosphate uridylyltransferase